jgi:hypothetical protein
MGESFVLCKTVSLWFIPEPREAKAAIHFPTARARACVQRTMSAKDEKKSSTVLTAMEEMKALIHAVVNYNAEEVKAAARVRANTFHSHSTVFCFLPERVPSTACQQSLPTHSLFAPGASLSTLPSSYSCSPRRLVAKSAAWATATGARRCIWCEPVPLPKNPPPPPRYFCKKTKTTLPWPGAKKLLPSSSKTSNPTPQPPTPQPPAPAHTDQPTKTCHVIKQAAQRGDPAIVRVLVKDVEAGVSTS